MTQVVIGLLIDLAGIVFSPFDDPSIFSNLFFCAHFCLVVKDGERQKEDFSYSVLFIAIVTVDMLLHFSWHCVFSDYDTPSVSG